MDGVGVPRRAQYVLGELDPNLDFNTPRWPQGQLRPITNDQENESQVTQGIFLGYYDEEEVNELTASGQAEDDTMPPSPPPVASPPPASEYLSDVGSEEEDPMQFGNVQDDDLVDDTMDRDLGDDDLDHDAEVDEQVESDEALLPEFDPAALGLKEINNLANFGVSSHKPGNGVAELLSDDLDKYWQ